MLNQICKALVISQNYKGQLKARTENNKDIRITNSSDASMIGKFIEVEVTDCTPWSLEGEIV